jgi:exopolysaccharide biosynthesis polyprenyl glycosylphosphotransferase
MSQKKAHFSISERKVLLRFFDVLFALEGVALMSFVFDFYYFDIHNDQVWIWGSTMAVYLLLFGEIFEMYNLRVANDKYLSVRAAILTTFATTLFYVFTPFITPELPQNRLQILYLFFPMAIAIIIWRFVYINFIFSPLFFKRVLLIGPKEVIEGLITVISEKARDNFIVGYISTEDADDKNLLRFDLSNENLLYLVKRHRVTEIVVHNFEESSLSDKITLQLIGLFENGYIITSSESFKENITNRIPESCLNMEFYQHLNRSGIQQNRFYLFFRRVLDLAVSILGMLILMLIIIPIVSIANIFGNKGKLFYFQERVGINGKIFKIIKLRTMIENAEENGAVWADKDDTRITKFGRFLRKTRIDEFPQFINILKGDMSLIGPRPERPEFVEELSKESIFYTTRHVIKPGLSGWAQVEYPYANTKKEQIIKLRYDLYYIKEQSLLLDFKIVIKTISTILFFRGS